MLVDKGWKKGSYKDRFLVSHGGTKHTLLCCKGVWVKCIDWILVNVGCCNRDIHFFLCNGVRFLIFRKCCKGVWVKCIDWTLVNGETSSQGEHQLADNVALFPESPHSQPDFHCKNSFRFVPERLFDQNSVGCHHLDRRGPSRKVRIGYLISVGR